MSAEHAKRAQRIEIVTPLRYRALTTRGWRAGVTVNISRTGVLFSGETAIMPGLAIEIWLTSPSSEPENEQPSALQHGFVVRSDASVQPPQIAVRFYTDDLAIQI